MIKTTQIPLLKQLKASKPSATLAINERSAQLISEGKKVYRFGFGQSPFPVPEVIVDALRKNAHHKDYLPGYGLPALRTAVAEHAQRTLGISADAEQVMIGPGSKELIYQTQMALNADLLLPSPSWVSYEPQANLVNKKIHWIDTKETNGWRITAESLQAACNKSETEYKILILNYPNNPSGTTYTEEMLQSLVNVLRTNNVIVIADEIYGEVHHEGKHVTLSKFYPEGTIVSAGLSKWAGAGGWRLGTFIFPKELDGLKKGIRVIGSETFSTVSAPIQYAAVTAFSPSQEITDYISNSRKVLKWIGNYMHQSLAEMNIHCPKPEGGFYLFPNFEHYRTQLNKKGINTSAELCKELLENTGVAVLPGSPFGRPETEFTARLAYVDFDGSQLLQVIAENENLDELSIDEHCPNIAGAMKELGRWVNTLT